MALHPQVLWAQRQNLVYITICVEDMEVEELKIDGKKVHIKGTKGKNGQLYETDMELYDELNGEMYKRVSTARALELIVPKVKESWWPRFLSQSVRIPWLKVDFNRWKDEDESDDEDPLAGMSGMGNMGNMFDASKMEELMAQYKGGEGLEDDDEDIPELDDVTEDTDNKKEEEEEKKKEETAN
uniref:CS domain-containing protein n=1 Tax=Parastrongyloides trichosuri TaxID=131310 RepID=A0A0N4ZCZ4_PARTI